MKRQVYVYDEELGKSVHKYIDLGPGKAEIGHGRPLQMIFSMGRGPFQSMVAGSKQLSGPGALHAS